MAARPTSRVPVFFILIVLLSALFPLALAAQEPPDSQDVPPAAAPGDFPLADGAPANQDDLPPEAPAPAAGFEKTRLESDSGDVTFWFEVGEDGVPIFTQILGWEEDPFALHFEILIRNDADEIILGEIVKENRLEVRLEPGSYSYRIITWNLLEKPDLQSDWLPLEVIKAEIPDLAGVEPGVIYMDTLDPAITLFGERLVEGGRVFLRDTDSSQSHEGRVVSRNEDGSISVLFPDSAYRTGLFTLVWMNPGGIEDQIEKGLRIRFQRPVDILVSAAWTPFVVLGDEWFAGVWPGPFDPLSLDTALSLYFIKARWGFVGVEAHARVLWLPFGGNEDVTVQNLYGLFGGALLYKYRITRNFHVQLGLGAGVALSWRGLWYGETAGPEQTSLDPSLNAALSFQYFFRNKVWIGLDLGAYAILHYETTAFGFVPALRVGYQLF